MKQFLLFAMFLMKQLETQKDRANNSEKEREIHLYGCINLIWKTINKCIYYLIVRSGGRRCHLYALKINLVILIPRIHISMITCIIDLKVIMSLCHYLDPIASLDLTIDSL
jgi:hypothetical protein